MHITRWMVLVPAVALSAACSVGGPPGAGGPVRGRDPLEKDVALAALQQGDQADHPVWLSGAVVCQDTPTAARPSAAGQARAARLLELGKGAALAGNTRAAQDLLQQAAYLDGTNAGVAYHLARASETAGDTTMAVREYCRYLSFGVSSAERAEVRERLLLLAPARTMPAAAARARSARTHPGARAAARRRTQLARAAPPRTPVAAATAAAGSVAQPAESAAASVGRSDGGQEGATYDAHADGAVATSPDRADGTVAQRTPAPSGAPERHTARDAAIGAVVGAAAGAAVSHDVKGAVLGAAAGGLLGAVIGRPRGSAGQP